MPRPVRTREGVFLLTAVVAGVGLTLAITGGPIALIVVLLVASAVVLTAGVAMEVLAFLRPRTDASRHHTSAGAETDRNPDAR